MVKVKKSYAENRTLYPQIYSKYCSHASIAEPNDPVYLDTQSMFKIDGKFVGITVKPRIRIWCPLCTKQTIEGTVKDSKLLKRDDHYELHLTVSKEVEFHGNPSSILAIDLGERNIATAVLWSDSRTFKRPLFLGRNVRGLRRHYAWLRKKLGEKKLLRMIRKIADTEQRKVNDILHKISRQIVEIAKQNNAVILIGDLSGIRNRSRGKRMNRIVANMPFYRLTQYITYKANWKAFQY
jgi:putative transposase